MIRVVGALSTVPDDVYGELCWVANDWSSQMAGDGRVNGVLEVLACSHALFRYASPQ